MTRIPRTLMNKVIKRIITLSGLPKDLKPRKELQRLRKYYLKPLELNRKENKDQLKTNWKLCNNNRRYNKYLIDIQEVKRIKNKYLK